MFLASCSPGGDVISKPTAEYTSTGYVDRGLYISFDDLSHKPVSTSRAAEYPLSIELPDGNADHALNNDGTMPVLATNTSKPVDGNKVRYADVGTTSNG